MARAVFVFVALLAALALADVQYNYNYNPYLVVDTPLDEADLCEQIGRLSGCSGCELGTKRLCAWVSVDGGSSDGKRAFETGQSFLCVPRTVAVAQEMTMVGHICPADPAKEPALRMSFSPVHIDKFPETSTIFSSSFDDDLAAFSHQPWYVDRTSFYGPLGAAFFDWESTPADRLDCPRIVSSELVDLQQEEGGAESTLLNGHLVDDHGKFCVRLVLSAYISSRCPEYGVAVSGLCQSFYDRIVENCKDPSRVPLGSNSGCDTTGCSGGTGSDRPSKAFESYLVVPDDTPFCLKRFPTVATGAMEALAGLHIPVDQLKKMADNGTPFTYD